MVANRQVVVFCVVLASLMMLASLVQCKKQEVRQPRYLPVRTYIQDALQDGLSGFAVYQDVAPEFRLQKHRKPPPSVQLCTYDRLGSHAWPPTAVCWVPPTVAQEQAHAVQTAADSAAAAAAAEPISAALKRQASSEEGGVVRPGVDELVVLEVGLPGQEGQSYKLNTVEHFLNKTGFRTKLAAIANMPMVQSPDALGASDMPDLGTSFRSLKFCHMRTWDLWEVLTFNAKALLLVAWAAWGLLRLRFPFSFSYYIRSLLFVGSSSPLEPFWKGTAALLVGPLLLFRELGSLLKNMVVRTEGQSFAVRGIDIIILMAVIGTSWIVIGLVKRTGRLEAALAASQADVQAVKQRLVQQESVHSASKADMKAAAKQHRKLTQKLRKLTQQQASLRRSLRRSDQQKVALQQKAMQLQQVSNSLQEMGCSMQQAHADMGKEVQLVRAELSKLQGEVAAMHRQAQSSLIMAGPGKEAEEAVGGTSKKQQTIESAISSPRIAAGRLRDHRGDYFSDCLLVEDNPYSPSFSGSFTTSFSPGVMHDMGAGSGQRVSLLSTPPISAPSIPIPPNTQSENQETFKTRRPALVKADSKLARLLSRFKQGS